VDNDALNPDQFFPGPGKGADRQKIFLYVHAETISFRQGINILIVFIIFSPPCFVILKRPAGKIFPDRIGLDVAAGTCRPALEEDG
jgi:hypothetical protein